MLFFGIEIKNTKMIYRFIAILCLFLFSEINAAPGDTSSVKTHVNQLIRTDPGVGYTAYKSWGVFPAQGSNIHKVMMKLSFKCPSGENCGEWDYLNYVYLRRKGGLDSTSLNIELARFITPYGNSFSAAWKSDWMIDVTDFEGLLRDSVEIEYQHTGYETNVGRGWIINLEFVITEGTPIRPFKKMQNLWQGSYSYGDVNNPINTLLGTQELTLGGETESLRMRIVQTGHGGEANEGCAEFCPKTRTLSRNGEVFSQKLVWRDNCGLNAVYPQGGTWVYDRGNWCPGDLVYPDAYDFTVSPASVQSFGMTMPDFVAASYANYVVRAYALEYGAPSFQTDASIEDILAPSDRYSYRRFNPICGNPQVILRNNGRNALTSAVIEYGPAGGIKNTFTWNGNLGFMASEEVFLPSNVVWGVSSGVFEVAVISANGQADDYSFNNMMRSNFTTPYVAPERLVVEFYTNNSPQENYWTIQDNSGNILYQRSGSTALTNFKDTVDLPVGCYKFIMEDLGKDGLSWWANPNAGNGFVRLRKADTGGMLKIFNADFGTRVEFPFTTGSALGIENQMELNSDVRIYPNPSQGKSQLSISLEKPMDVHIEIFNSLGQIVSALNPSKGEVITLDLPVVSAGIYFVKVQTGASFKTIRWVVTQ